MNFGLESAAALMAWDIGLSASTHWLRKKQHENKRKVERYSLRSSFPMDMGQSGDKLAVPIHPLNDQRILDDAEQRV